MSINGHDLFGNVSFDLSDSEDVNVNYKTVVIGPNGTGKSTILSCLADAITIECSEKKNKSLTAITYGYDLQIKDGEKELLVSSSDLTKIKKYGKGKILAISSTPNDRFPYLAKNSVRKTQQYCYLGMKSASNNIFFANMKEKLFQDIVVVCNSLMRVKGARRVLGELGFSSKFSITLDKGSNFSVFQKASVDGVLHANGGAKFQNAAFSEFIASTLFKKNRKSIDKIVRETNDSIAPYKINANIATIRRNKILLDKIALIANLVAAKILTITSFSIFSENGIDLHQASSGEFNILKIFLSILANVENNSVILIDEPEVSLHPNWQISFLDLLDKTLEDFSGCHSVIATHSHFILSNLQDSDSTILALQRNHSDNSIEINKLDVHSYGWSPEHTLYEVFGVTGFRNKYLELDLRILISYISNGQGNFAEFSSAVKRVAKFNIQRNDPLYKLIQNAKAMTGGKSAKSIAVSK